MPRASQAWLTSFRFIIRTKQVVLSSPAGALKWVKEVAQESYNETVLGQRMARKKRCRRS